MSILNETQLGQGYYHGTGGGLEGDEVRPTSPKVFSSLKSSPHNDRLKRPAAYATESPKEATRIAGDRAHREGRLFGSVYEVTPRTVVATDESNGMKYGPAAPTGVAHHTADFEGMAVLRHVGYSNRNGDPL